MIDAILPLIADSLAVETCRAGFCRVFQSGGRLWEVSPHRWELLGNVALGSCDGVEGLSVSRGSPCLHGPPHQHHGMCCLIFRGAFEPRFSTTTRGPWLWWASSWVLSSRRVKNIFSIKWLNTHGAPVALSIELLLTTSFRSLGNETAISLEKRNEVRRYELFQVAKLSFQREINHSKQRVKTTDRKTRQQGVEETQSLASLAHPHHGRCLINLSICWTGR